MEKDAMPGDNRECANLKNLDPWFPCNYIDKVCHQLTSMLITQSSQT